MNILPIFMMNFKKNMLDALAQYGEYLNRVGC